MDLLTTKLGRLIKKQMDVKRSICIIGSIKRSDLLTDLMLNYLQTHQCERRKLLDKDKAVWWETAQNTRLVRAGEELPFGMTRDRLLPIYMARCDRQQLRWVQHWMISMAFHVRWIFLTPEDFESHSSHLRREVANPSQMENYTRHIFSHTLHFKACKSFGKVEYHENRKRLIFLSIVLNICEKCILQYSGGSSHIIHNMDHPCIQVSVLSLICSTCG